MINNSECFINGVNKAAIADFFKECKKIKADVHRLEIIENGEIVLDSLMEYFSEGYRAYFQAPDLLKEKDPALYEFIGGLKDDKG